MLREAAVLLCSISILASAQQPSGTVSIFLANPSSASHAVTSSVRTELHDLLATSGIHLLWHDGVESVSGRLAVIRLQGTCKSEAPNTLPDHQVSRDPEALGSTHVSNGEVLPFADIRCDHIRRFVAAPLMAAPTIDARDEMLGRAVARVIAHELYHIVLRTRAHSKTGVARAAQSAAQLVSPRLNFSHEDEQRLSAEAVNTPVVSEEEVSILGRSRN